MVDATRILITGPTGNVGSAVLDNLGTTDINLRTLAHNESKAKALRDGSRRRGGRCGRFP